MRTTGDAPDAASVAALLDELDIRSSHFAGLCEFRGARVYVKLRTVKLATSLRLVSRQLSDGWGAPRLREAYNLRALRALGIGAVQPLGVAADHRWGLLRRELLLTRWVDGAVDLARATTEGLLPVRGRAELLARIGAIVGRMHWLGFHHRDLFPRNILLAPGEEQLKVLLLDCPKGGFWSWPGRGATYDLGCFEAWAATWYSREEREGFFQAYFAAHPIADKVAWLGAVERARRGIVRRYLRTKRRAHWQGRSPLAAPEPLRLERLTPTPETTHLLPISRRALELTHEDR